MRIRNGMDNKQNGKNNTHGDLPRRAHLLRITEERSLAGQKGAASRWHKSDGKENSKPMAPLGSGSGIGNGSVPEGVQGEGNPPWSRESFDAAAKSLSCPPSEADKCWAYYDSQGWLKSNGRKITGMDARSLLTTWLANPRRAETTKTEKELSTWEIKTRLDAIQGELNKTDLDSKKLDVAARRKLLFTEKSRLRQMQTGVTA